MEPSHLCAPAAAGGTKPKRWNDTHNLFHHQNEALKKIFCILVTCNNVSAEKLEATLRKTSHKAF